MEREAFLARVTVALSRATAPSAGSARVGAPPRRGLPTRREALIELFAARLEGVGGQVRLAKSREAAQRDISAILAEHTQTVSCDAGMRWPGLERSWTDRVVQADAGLVEAAAGVADTGSVLLRHGGGLGRGYSLLPPRTLVLLPASRLVSSLGDALAFVCDRDGRPPVCATFVTGASHSADIACVPCRGVHGPGEVHVWVIEDE